MNWFFRLAAQEEDTLWQIIKDEISRIWNVVLNPGAEYYKNLPIDSETLTGIRTIGCAVILGILLAMIFSAFNRRVLGNFVRALIAADCLAPEKAKTLGELGFAKNFAVRRSLTRGVLLRNSVRCVEEDEWDAANDRRFEAYQKALDEATEQGKPKPERFRESAYTIRPEQDHFYIPEEKKYTAEMKFEKKGSDGYALVLSTFVLLVGFVLFFLLLPDILHLLDNILGML